MKLVGKTALVTGGNSGIGLEAARMFVNEGARVIITGRDEAKLTEATQQLGPNAIAFAGDVGDANSISEMGAFAVETFGSLNVLFANAGISGATPLGKTPSGFFEEIIRINLTGTFLTVETLAPCLAPGASVILNSSVHATLGAPYYSAYAASKAAVRAMGRVLASEMASRKIRVNVVTPGAISTPIWSRSGLSDQARAKLEGRAAKTNLQGRFGAPEEIARAVLFLAADDSSFVTGAEIVVDGGATGSPAGAQIYTW